MITEYWAKTYGVEGTEKFTCPECGQSTGAVAGDTFIGTRYGNGRFDSSGWRVLKCGHSIGVYDYADGSRQIVLASDSG